MENYTLGLDIGISSVGACAINQTEGKLLELSIRKFEEASEAAESRLNRSARRNLRRKKWRKEQLIAAFDDFNIISKDEINKNKPEFLNFNTSNDLYVKPDCYTIYHLRQKAIKEKVTKREMFLCLYNILQARGHFLLETINFANDSLSYELYKEKFYQYFGNEVEITEKKKFEEEILEEIYYGIKDGKTNFKNKLKKNSYTIDEIDDDKLYRICYVLAGGKEQIGMFYGNDEEPTINVDGIKGSDEVNDFQAKIVELFDISRIAQVLKEGNEYVCDIAVNEINKYREIKESDSLTEEQENYFKELFSISKSKPVDKAGKIKKHIRSYKNIRNSYPNGLYVKEASAILNNQQKYYKEITNEFIEVCTSIISARIPFYIGPLNKEATNAWVKKNGNIKYSYDYSIKHFENVVDEYETIKEWKSRMISHCTYLPEETAMPKGSLIGEVYSILNEINNFLCLDKDENDYYLTREDKIKIIDNLFLKNKEVTLEQVRELLDLKTFKSKKGSTRKFNNKITLYQDISRIIERLKFDSIIELFKDKEKLEEIEAIIEDINLFDEEKAKRDYFRRKYDEDVAIKLSKINVKGFYSVSRKLVLDTPLNENGESMLEILFNDNVEGIINNQQVILSNACDKDGNAIDFLQNKYERIIIENNNELSIDLLIKNGKPSMPISRNVIRALNETMKVYKGYVDIYGVPNRVVIETAKGEDSIKDFTEQNGSTMKHYDKTNKLLDYLNKQIKEYDKNNEILEGKIESWEVINEYYEKHKLEIELYIRQDGIDLLTGKKIDIAHLENYEIDHILPRGFGDDSQDDKMLTIKEANAIKGDRLPIEFLESSDATNFTKMTVGKYTKIVNKLAEMKMISSKKQERLLLRSDKELEGFINQNLVDTRYIISQFNSILKAYNKVNNYNTYVTCLNGSYTSLYRKYLGFRKDRDLGDQHHAYDAACLCIADNCLNTYFPFYDLKENAKGRKYSGMSDYHTFVQSLNKLKNKKLDDDSQMRSFISQAFRLAYHQDIYKNGKNAPLLESIKSTTPLLSWKVEKNYDGKYFDETLYPAKGEDDKSVLSILGINNDKRSFDSINCVAVDFYKINHKHYSIHIPLAIIDKKGNINKEKYLKLIKEHYKAKNLLDEEGNLIEKAFRFRVFKKDMIYDNISNECYLFNIGSISNNKIEIKHLNVFSYKQIYSFADSIRNEIIKKYNVKTKASLNGIDFNELNKKVIIEYLCNELSLLNNKEKHMKQLIEKTKDIKNIYEFSNMISLLSTTANTKYAPPTINGQILPVVNNVIVKENIEKSEYIKLKYNILGLRFTTNENGTLIVSGPNHYKNGGFKKIKKEPFYWTISKEMVE